MSRIPDADDLIDHHEAAKLLRVQVDTVTRYFRTGRLPGWKSGKVWLTRRRFLLDQATYNGAPRTEAVGGDAARQRLRQRHGI